jgi:hypothetical protein
MNTHVRDNLVYLNDSRIKYGQITANGPTVTTTETDVITAPAFTPISATRLIRVSIHVRGINGSVANDAFSYKIKEGATQLNEETVWSLSSGTGSPGFDMEHYIPNPSAAAHTYKMTGVRSTGTGNQVVQAAATYPCQIIVEDVGAA